MDTIAYDDFRLSFTARPDGSFDVRALDPGGREASGLFELPLPMLEERIHVLGGVRSRRVAPAPDQDPFEPLTRDIGETGPRRDAAEELGTALAAAVFRDDVARAYDAANRDAARLGRGLRLSLSLDRAPALLNVPWEFLCREDVFLASQRESPLVRVLQTGSPLPAPHIAGAVRVLGVISNPSDLRHLDVAAERRNIEEALATSIAQGRVALEWLEPATRKELLKRVRDHDYHVLHFVGHGACTPSGGELFLEDDSGRSSAVDSGELKNVLGYQKRTLRLVVLNSCEGGRTSLEDPFAGVAMTLIRLGVPAVVAMQFEISDEVAIAFARELYERSMGGQAPIDAAVNDARMYVMFGMANSLEWATPVLYVRDPELQLFSFSSNAVAVAPPPQPPPIEDGPTADRPGPSPAEGPAAAPRPPAPPRASEPSRRDDHPAPRAHRDRERRTSWRRWAAALLAAAALVVGIVLVTGALGDDGGPSSRLAAGATLSVGDRRRSTSGRTELELLPGGALRATTDGEEWWRSDNRDDTGTIATLQLDGNLVVYPSPDRTAEGDALWASGTAGHPNAYLEVSEQDGRGLVAIIDPAGAVVWAERHAPAGAAPTPTAPPPTESVPAMVRVPDVAGQPSEAAQHVLTSDELGFQVQVRAEPHATIPTGIVIETDPPAGSSARRGSSVELVVSSGSQVEVPSVVGLDEQAARDELRHFTVQTRQQDLPAGDPNDGRVIAQSLPPGRVEAIGTAITITAGNAAGTTRTTG